LIEDLNPVVAAIADEDAAPRVDRDGVERVKLARPPAALTPRLDELSVLRKPHHAVVAVVVMAIGHEDVAACGNRDIARRIEVIRTDPGLPECAERHQRFSVWSELDDHLSAFVAL